MFGKERMNTSVCAEREEADGLYLKRETLSQEAKRPEHPKGPAVVASRETTLREVQVDLTHS